MRGLLRVPLRINSFRLSAGHWLTLEIQLFNYHMILNFQDRSPVCRIAHTGLKCCYRYLCGGCHKVSAHNYLTLV